jgi:hypothetical protein
MALPVMRLLIDSSIKRGIEVKNDVVVDFIETYDWIAN